MRRRSAFSAVVAVVLSVTLATPLTATPMSFAGAEAASGWPTPARAGFHFFGGTKAFNDLYYAGRVNPFVVNKPGILANDIGSSLTVAEVNGSKTNVGKQITLLSGSKITVNKDGGFKYEPKTGWHGWELFSYRFHDGKKKKNSGLAFVKLIVAPTGKVNQAPVAEDDEYLTTWDEALATNGLPGLLANDFDPDGPHTDLRVSAVNGAGFQGSTTFTLFDGGVQLGQVTVHSDGNFQFNPIVGRAGIGTFSYTVRDAKGATDTAKVEITVGGIILECGPNQFPVGRDGISYSVVMRPSGDCDGVKPSTIDFGHDDDGFYVLLAPIVTDGEVFAFLESLEWPPVVNPGGQVQFPYTLRYDDTPPFNNLKVAPQCLDDPRTADGNDLDPAAVAHAIAAFVNGTPSNYLPDGHSTCIISATFTSVGGTHTVASYILFNVGDGKRTFN